MAYCGPKGIPLSTFLGWPEADQDAALAWQAHEAQRCRECGTHPDEWSRTSLAYHAEVHFCAGCEVLHGARGWEQLKEPGNHLHMARGAHRDCPTCSPAD